MDRFLKVFVLSCFCGIFHMNSFAQYNANTGVYQRKNAPTDKISNQNKTTSSQSAGIRSVYEEGSQTTTRNTPQNNSNSTTPAQRAYNRRSVSGEAIPNNVQRRATTTSTTRTRNAGNEPYQIKNAPITNGEETMVDAYKNAKTLNFDALSESGRATRRNTQTARRSTSYYRNHYSNSIKVYNQRGQQVSPTISNLNRSVIIVPRTGLTVTGIVTSDDPGRSITIKDNEGKSISFQYSEMDALVNI